MNIRTLAAITLSLACLALSTPAFAQDSPDQSAQATAPAPEQPDFNRAIYYKNKLELGFDAGFYPYNTRFIFDWIQGENWARAADMPDYTLVPLTLSLRWHLDDIGGPWFLRGNTDVTFSGNYTVIPKGPESYYASFMTGARYNFVQPNWRVAPYVEGRVGCGFTDAQGPNGVKYAQGQDFTFTFSMGGGLRYNFDPRYSVSAGITYMHISNLYTSKAYNWGLNVFGPTVGVNIGF
ncbi:MAG: acyloxyacyl hydrolase [Desulfobacteraceae bacterium]|nr:acyloxyacyl hydrolase [Desulfobacteraceae bacterium]